jgi:hypothetical protein
MVTKEQLAQMNGYGELHCTLRHHCHEEHGPRGGIKVFIDTVRLSGRLQIWKRDETRFRQPWKYGLYENGAIEPYNASDFHLPEDCPLAKTHGV